MHLRTPLTPSRGFGPAIRTVWPIAWSAVLRGGLAIAVTDFIYCILFWSPQGVAPTRILQGIAAGALGKASFSGGLATALLGAGFQWLIGCGFVLAYALMARHANLLLRYPHRYGIAYGMALYIVMSLVVVPLSAAPQSAHPNVVWMLTNIPMFAVFGTIAAVFARRAIRNSRSS